MTLFAGLRGVRVEPGTYTARVEVRGQRAETTFRLLDDPRIVASPKDRREWSARVGETAQLLERTLIALGELRVTRDQVQALMAVHPDQADLQQSGQAALDAIEAWDHRVIQPLHETYEDEDAWETMLAGQIRFLLDGMEVSGAPVTAGALDRLRDLQAEFDDLARERPVSRTNWSQRSTAGRAIAAFRTSRPAARPLGCSDRVGALFDRGAGPFRRSGFGSIEPGSQRRGEAVGCGRIGAQVKRRLDQFLLHQ
jgi:hypothetical protein